MGLSDIAGGLIDGFTGGNLKRAWLEDDGGQRVVLDVVVDQQRDSNALVSRHAVESAEGSITDNVKSDPKTMNLKVVLSNHTGMSLLNPASYARVLKSTFGSAEDTIKPRLEILDQWQDLGTLLTYRSRSRVMKSCVIQKGTDTVNEATGDGLGLTLTLNQITIANAEIVTIELKKPQGARKAPAKVNASGLKRGAKGYQKDGIKGAVKGVFGQ